MRLRSCHRIPPSEEHRIAMSVETNRIVQAIGFCILFLLEILGTASNANAQSEINDYSRVGQAALGTTLVTDYQAIGVNPANLGFPQLGIDYIESSPEGLGLSRRIRRFSVSMGESGVAVNSDAMNSSNLLSSMFSINDQVFSYQQKLDAARRFSGRGVYINADAILLGVSYQSENAGGFAFTMRERVSAQFVLNSFAAEFAFLGRRSSYFDSSYVLSWKPTDTVGVARNPKLYSTLFDSTRISMSWTREYNIAYGKRIMNGREMKMYVGLGVKYIQGFALLNSYIDENKQLIAYSSITPLFNINYGKSTTPSKVVGGGLLPVGQGFGVDFGMTISYNDKWKFGFSVLDIGKVYWQGNVYTAQDYIMNGVSSTGFNSYNIFQEAQKITGDGGYFKWSGLLQTTTALPTRVRFGGTYTYGIQQDAGIDIIVPVNTLDPANLNSALVSVGTNYGIYPWLLVQGGMTFGGTMGFNMPVGVLFSIFDGFWEFGISSRDLLTYVFDKNPTVSLSVATCRLRF